MDFVLRDIIKLKYVTKDPHKQVKILGEAALIHSKYNCCLNVLNSYEIVCKCYSKTLNRTPHGIGPLVVWM